MEMYGLKYSKELITAKKEGGGRGWRFKRIDGARVHQLDLTAILIGILHPQHYTYTN